MTRKALLITLLGVSLPVVIAASPQTDWERAHPPRPYRHVGTNPRGTPVLSWRDALNYMQYHPRFQQDLTVLLPQGLTPQMRQAYWPRIVDEVRGSVEVAQAHHFMNGTCTLCASRGCSHCVESEELSHRFQRLAIPRGTRYLALTEGRDGRVTFNRIFLGDAMAYRVNVLGGRGYIDLIARCRNTALGQRQEWEEYTAFTPPPAGTPLPPPAIGAPPAIATAPTPLPAPAERVAGSLTTNNYYPAAAPPMAYIGPGPAMSYPRGYEAGSLTLWFQPSVNVRINQASPTAVSPAGGTTPTGGTGTGTGTNAFGSGRPRQLQHAGRAGRQRVARPEPGHPGRQCVTHANAHRERCAHPDTRRERGADADARRKRRADPGAHHGHSRGHAADPGAPGNTDHGHGRHRANAGAAIVE